jgi:hypothetical protein
LVVDFFAVVFLAGALFAGALLAAAFFVVPLLEPELEDESDDDLGSLLSRIELGLLRGLLHLRVRPQPLGRGDDLVVALAAGARPQDVPDGTRRQHAELAHRVLLVSDPGPGRLGVTEHVPHGTRS